MSDCESDARSFTSFIDEIPNNDELALFSKERFLSDKNVLYTNIIAKLQNPMFSSKETYERCKDNKIILFIPAITKSAHICDPKFIKQIFNDIEELRRTGVRTHIAETQDPDSSGIMLDFDIDHTSDECQITEQLIYDLVENITSLLISVIQIESSVLIFRVVIVKAEKPRSKSVMLENGIMTYRESLHILIPEIKVSRQLKKYILHQLIDKQELLKIIKNEIPDLVSTNPLDEGSAHVPVFLLGSCKPDIYKVPDVINSMYQITVSGVNNFRIKELKDFTDINLAWSLSLNSNVIYKDGDKPKILFQKKHYLPKLEIADKVKEVGNKKLQALMSDTNIQDDIFNNRSDSEFELIRQLLDACKDFRSNEYSWWNLVMCILANRGEKYKCLAMKFSARSPKFDMQNFEIQWKNYCDQVESKKNIPKSINILKTWVREDSYSDFTRIIGTNSYELLTSLAYSQSTLGELSHNCCARVIHSLIGHKFVYIVQEGWYEFISPKDKCKVNQEFKYRLCHENLSLLSFISDTLVLMVTKLLRNVENKIEKQAKTVKERNLDFYSVVAHNLKKTNKNLGSNNFKEAIIRECRQYFVNYELSDKKDSYEDILPVGNGILKLGRMPYLINYSHGYLVTKYTETKYYDYDPNNFHIKKVENILRSLFPDEEQETFEFMMCWLASSIDYKKKEPLMLYVYGSGSAGKTMMSDMLKYAIGNKFCKELTDTLLTKPFGDSSGANPALCSLKGTRAAIIDEVGADSIISDMNLKKLTGGDISTRELYKGQETISIHSRITLITNHNLSLSSSDYGTLRRIIYVVMKMQFLRINDATNPYNAENRYHRVCDGNIKDVYIRTQEAREAMLSVLVKWYQIFQIKYNGIISNIPRNKINTETSNFINNQNSLNRFICERVVKTKDDSSSIILNNLVNEYIAWYKNNINLSGKLPASNIVLDNIKNNSFLKNYENNFVTSRNKLVLIGFRFLEEGDVPGDDEKQFTYSKHKLVDNNGNPKSEFISVDHRMTLREYYNLNCNMQEENTIIEDDVWKDIDDGMSRDFKKVESSSEDEKPTKKPVAVKKKISKIVENSSDESSEEEKPKKKSVIKKKKVEFKPKAKPVRKIIVESSSDETESETESELEDDD